MARHTEVVIPFSGSSKGWLKSWRGYVDAVQVRTTLANQKRSWLNFTGLILTRRHHRPSSEVKTGQRVVRSKKYSEGPLSLGVYPVDVQWAHD